MSRKLWGLALSSCLTAIYFTLIWIADDVGHLTISILVYVCVSTLLWEKRKQLLFELDWLSCTVGWLLIAWVFGSSTQETNEYFVRLIPFVSGLAIALITAGWRQLKQLWQPLLLLFVLSVPSVLAYYFVDIAPLTAKASALMLWYLGFDVKVHGIIIGLAGSKPIEVVYDCSGIDMVLYMLTLSFIGLTMFPTTGFRRAIFPFLSVVLGFLLNGIRIAMLTLFNSSNQEAFNRWHTGTGSYTFALIGVVILGTIYWHFLTLEMPIRESSQNQS